MIADEFSIGIVFLYGERLGRKENRKKRKKGQTFGKREKYTNVYLRFGVASSAPEKEWRTIKIRDREKERDERDGAKERFSVIALGVYPRGWVYIADHQTK